MAVRYATTRIVGDLKDTLGLSVKKNLRECVYNKIVRLGVRSTDDMSMAGLTHADLREANLSTAVMHTANLREENLAGANLAGANLSNAMLSDANLANANLREANLTGANLRFANLSGANLRGANLSKVKTGGVTAAQSGLWSRALYDARTIWPVDFDPVAAGALKVG